MGEQTSRRRPIGDGIDRLLRIEQAEAWVTERRRAGEMIVFTNGCFDLLHVGHLRYLVEAARLGDRLLVGLNSDRSVSELKGESRPLVPERERAEMLLALRPVDRVVIFEEETPLELIRRIAPDVLVKGGDYDPEATAGDRYIVGSDLVRAGGGRVCTIPLVPGRSSSRLASELGRQ